MGGRLTSPPSSASSSSATAHRTAATGSTSNLAAHPRTHSTSNNHASGHHHHHHRHRSSSGHHNPTHHSRHRTTSTNVDPLSPSAAFNFNFLRYVGLEHESDDQSTDDESPQARRRLQRIFIALRDVPCPVCHKTIPGDSFDKHIVQCLSKPRIDYNGQCSFARSFASPRLPSCRRHADGRQR